MYYAITYTNNHVKIVESNMIYFTICGSCCIFCNN